MNPKLQTPTREQLKNMQRSLVEFHVSRSKLCKNKEAVAHHNYKAEMASVALNKI